MRKRIKKIVALAVSGAMLLGLFACGRGEAAGGGEGQEAVMGRYLESDLPLPVEGASLLDMNFLSDGSLRVSVHVGDELVEIWDTPDLGETWTKNEVQSAALAEANPDRQWIDNVDIGSDGRIAYSILGDAEDAEEIQLWVGILDEEGNRTDLTGKITGSETYPQLSRMEFTDEGSLMVQGFGSYLKLFDSTTGEELQDFSSEGMVTFALLGETLFVTGSEGVELYHWADGTPLETDEVLNDQILANKRNLQITTTSSLPITAANGETEGSMFYCTSEGIFSHMLDGSVSEKVVDGSLCSLSSTAVGFKRLLVRDGEFYLLVIEDSEYKILRYTYSADTPAVPATTLRLYSLTEDDNLRQLVPVFQKKYPDIYVDYQVGMTGEDGVTLTDALKNLNTEIMAGKGPDVLLLDGINADPYVERGMLADIRDVVESVDEEEGLLDNVVEAYDGSDGLYMLPSRIGLPMLLGMEEELSQAKDLASFAKAAGEMAKKDPQNQVLSPYLCAQSLVTVLNRAVAPAWMNEEGGVDEEALKAAMEQMNALYSLEDHSKIEEEMVNYSGGTPDFYLPSLDEMTLYAGLCRVAYGVMGGPDEFASACQLNQELGTALMPFGEKGKEYFLPVGIFGVNSQSAHMEEAKELVRYMLSSEAQLSVRFGGFSVNEAVLSDEDHYWDRGGEGFSSGVTYATEDGAAVDAVMDVEPMTSQEIQTAIGLLKEPKAASPYNSLILETVNAQTVDYLLGEVELEEAVENVTRIVNLYLAEQ